MSLSVNMESKSPSSEPGTPLQSCVSCKNRKIKCNRQQPCSNCNKSDTTCNYVAPAPPRRRKGAERKLSEEDLYRRLRKYETLLRAYGAKIEELVDSQNDHDFNKSPGRRRLGDPDNQREKAGSAMKEATSKNLAPSEAPLHNLWTTLSDELLEDFSEADHDSSMKLDSLRCSPVAEETIFTFDPCSQDSNVNHFHPPSFRIFRLWQAFLDNVNPLVKILHIPTVQVQILESSVDTDRISKPIGALMFAIYSCAVTSLSDDECRALMGESRWQLRARYHKATQQALIGASLFKTTEIIVLQAAVLFLISVRLEYDPGEFWVLSGMVIRIGQRMGLHMESNPQKYSVLEIELRRRLWWQMSVLDARGAERSGTGTTITPGVSNISLPLNVNDSDLSPDMGIPPSDQVGATEMILVLSMYEVGTFLRHSKSMAQFNGSWRNLSSHMVPLAEKDKVIDDLENILHNKFLRYCDPMISLHIFAKSMVKMVVNRMRLTTRHPRHYPDRGLNMSSEEKEKLFNICLMIMEQDNLMRSTRSIRGFLWHADLHFQLDAFIYLLHALRQNTTGPSADKAWSEIALVYSHHRNLIEDTRSQLHIALRNLTLRSWHAREVSYNLQHQSSTGSTAPPSFISELRTQSLAHSTDSEYLSWDLSTHNSQPVKYSEEDQSMSNMQDNFNESMMFPDLQTGMIPIDWSYWDDLSTAPN